MAASLDGFVARIDGGVDWMSTEDKYSGGETMTPEFVEEFLNTIDCYVMGSRTYEMALGFDNEEHGWAYGEKPVYVLTNRELPVNRDTVELHADDLSNFINEELKQKHGSIWVVGGCELCTECINLGLVDEISYTILPVMIGEGIPFFSKLKEDVKLHLAEHHAYDSGVVELRYEVVK